METQEISKGISGKNVFTYIHSKKNITKLLSLGFGIILITWLLSQLEFTTTVKILREIPISLLVFSFCCYALAFYLRSVRFKLLLPSEKPVQHLFSIVLIHYTALNIIPARLGELSYIYLLKRINNISTGCSLSNLILARAFDHITLSMMFLVSSLFLDFSSPWLQTLSWGISGFLVVTFVILMFILTYKERCVLWLTGWIRKFHLHHYTITQNCMHEIEEIVKALKIIQVKEQAGKVFGISVLIWLSIFGQNYCLLRAFQVDLAYSAVIWSSTCIILLRFLPLQLISGFGIHETTWVFIALALGIPKTIAITSAFGSHILSIVFLVIFGICGLLRLQHFLTDKEKKNSLNEL